MKNFVTALDKERDAFKYHKQIFSKVSDIKFKAWIFFGPQIQKICY